MLSLFAQTFERILHPRACTLSWSFSGKLVHFEPSSRKSMRSIEQVSAGLTLGLRIIIDAKTGTVREDWSHLSLSTQPILDVVLYLKLCVLGPCIRLYGSAESTYLSASQNEQVCHFSTLSMRDRRSASGTP